MYNKITVLGSTGSVGKQTLAICQNYNLSVVSLACKSNWCLLLQQIRQFQPAAAALCTNDKNLIAEFKEALAATVFSSSTNATYCGPQVFCGEDAAEKLVEFPCDLAVGAISGLAGLASNSAFLQHGVDLALANKESIVCGAAILDRAKKQSNSKIISIDSEHAAINECLKAGRKEDFKKIWLTASGGPFRNWPAEKIAQAELKDALRHPTWNMGAKITVDSASMMNKGLEIIEACYLFQVNFKQVEVVVHPQSIIHSAVEWQDGQVTAQMSFPDMQAPIKAAIFTPAKIAGVTQAFNFFDARACSLTFYPPDFNKFPCLSLAQSAIMKGGIYPLVLNAANEAAVNAFLEEKIRFGRIAQAVAYALDLCAGRRELPAADDLATVLALDKQYRTYVREYLHV